MHILFDNSSLKNFTVKYAWFGTIMEWMTFSEVSQKESMWVRIKHAKKSCIDLWEQLLILEAIEADYQSLGKSYKEVVWSVLTNNEVLSREVS